MLSVMRVGEFYVILFKLKHNCFPVVKFLFFLFHVLLVCNCLCAPFSLQLVESDESNILLGSILRKTICTLLKHKAFAPSHVGSSHTGTGASAGVGPGALPQRLFPLVAWGTLECTYPRYPNVDQLNLSDADR